MRVKATPIKEIYKNGDYRIIAWSPLQVYENLALSKYLTFTTKGENPYITMQKEYELEIEELSSNNYGTTYKIISIPSMENQDISNLSREQSLEILMDCTSSETIANNILDAYPNFIEIIMTQGKDVIDTKKIKGVGQAYLSAYSREILSKYKYYTIIQELKDYEVNVTDCKVLFAEYHNNEEEIKTAIKKTPYYVLIKVLGRSFLRVDKMLQTLRPDLIESDQRCEFMILTTLEANEVGDNGGWFDGGDTKLSASKLWNYAKDYAPEISKKMKTVAQNSPLIYYNEETNELAQMETYLGEKKIANFIQEKINNPHKWDLPYNKYKEIKDGILTDEQSLILKSVCENDITIVNAKAGTGKTSALKAVIQMLTDSHKTYTLLSPTGKVATRIKEQTGKQAFTIHRACLSGQINSDLIVVEEFGMIGVELLCMLISSVSNPNTKFLFNGDLGQISPIQCGCPMRDIIDSGKVSVCTLSQVFRYGEGGLYKMATDAYNGKFYIQDLLKNNEDKVQVGKNKDYTFVRYNGDVEQVIDEYKTLLDRGIKPINISIVTPWNITEFGSININNKIQSIVNPPIDTTNKDVVNIKIRGYNVEFRINDIILNTKNCYNILTLAGYNKIKESPILTEDDVETTSVMNGETGRIVNIEDGNIIAQFGENVIVFDKLKSKHLLLGYCLTSFKLQGSENEYIITLITPQFKKSLNKNIIYTDMTRGQKEVIEIIDPTILGKTIGIDVTENRKTNLKFLINSIDK